MDTLFQRLGSTIKPASGTKILRASDYSQLLKAQDLLDAAEAEAEQIRQKAEIAYEEREKQGYEDGVAQGQLQQAEKMLETSLQAVSYLEGLEHQLVEVVSTAVRKIIGELDDKERIVRVVRTALDQVRGRQQVVVRLCPDDEPYVRENLGPLLSPGNSAHLELVADQHLKPGSCMLESEMGVLDASLSVQLKAIEHALAAKIGDKNLP